MNHTREIQDTFNEINELRQLTKNERRVIFTKTLFFLPNLQEKIKTQIFLLINNKKNINELIEMYNSIDLHGEFNKNSFFEDNVKLMYLYLKDFNKLEKFLEKEANRNKLRELDQEEFLKFLRIK